MKTNCIKVAYCTILLFLFNITSYSQDNWSWLNPKPMGSSVESCGYFPGTNTVIAVGANGLIMRSTDNGTNWSHIQSNLASRLSSVSLTSSTTGYIAGESATLLKTTDAGATWASVNTGLSGTFNQIDFVDNSIGFLRQGSEINKIYKTTNGGTSWIDLLIDGSNGNLTTFNALSALEILYGTSTGNVIKTSSPSWSPSLVKTFTVTLQVVSITVNGSNVVAATGDSLLAYSTDSGASWSSEITLSGVSFAGVEFISSTNLVAYTASETIRISADRGATWAPVTTSPTQQLFTATSNLSGNGIILGSNGIQYTTTNSGTTWIRTLNSIFTGTLRSIVSISSNIWAAGDSGKVIRSTDAGASWVSTTVVGDTVIQDIKFTNATTGYFVAGSSIYKSIDGGITWIFKKKYPGVPLYEISFFDENVLLVSGSSKNTYRSTDGGETWSDAIQVSNTGTIYSVFAYPGLDTAYCAGTSGKVFKSVDRGQTWSIVKNASGIINSIWFSTPTIGWAVGYTDIIGTPGKILKTTNGGLNWGSVPDITTTILQSVRFSDANNGIIVGNLGTILKTTDGGTTWTKSAQVTDNALMSAALIDGSTTLVAGYAGNIIKSSNAPLPVELVSFTASVRNNEVHLNWETATEVDNYGFEIERKDKNSTWTKIGFIDGHTTSNSPKYYTFSDNPSGSSKYSYRLKQIDNDGKFEYSGIVEVDLSGMLPKDIEIKNFPNPFNPETYINIKLPETAETTVELYNSTGEKIFTIYKGKLDVGTTLSLKVDGSNLPSGVYLINVSAGKYRKTHKILLMK